jgi:hypothetical protein
MPCRLVKLSIERRMLASRSNEALSLSLTYGNPHGSPDERENGARSGANAGIGKAIAFVRAREPVDVAIGARRKEPLEAAASQIAHEMRWPATSKSHQI